MELLVLSPPVCTPAEPAAGAFTLAAGLAGRGLDVGLLDLSLEHFYRVLEDTEMGGPEIGPAMQYLLEADGGYDAQRHRSAAGLLHARLRGFGKRWPGWNLTRPSWRWI